MTGGQPASLDGFIRHAAGTAGSGFWNVSDRMLGIDVDGSVWLKPGSPVACSGNLRFERRRTLDAGSLTDAVLRETAPLVRASGRGRLYCGHHGAHVTTLRLDELISASMARAVV